MTWGPFSSGRINFQIENKAEAAYPDVAYAWGWLTPQVAFLSRSVAKAQGFRAS
jgi:hypothetical protein